MPLIEVAVQLLLPTGQTQPLCALLDIGATDNFANKQIVDEFALPITTFSMQAPVQLGTEGATVDALQQ